MGAQSAEKRDTLLSWAVPGMAVYDRYCEKLGTVKRVELDARGAFLEVETERWPQNYHVTSDQISSVGFARLWLRVTGADLVRV
jgi:hypothetical protein